MYSTYFGGGQPAFENKGGIGTQRALDCRGCDGQRLRDRRRQQDVNLPVTAGAFQQSCPFQDGATWIACRDAFVTKLSPNGSTFVYATYLGGTPIRLRQRHHRRRGWARPPHRRNVVTGLSGGRRIPADKGHERKRRQRVLHGGEPSRHRVGVLDVPRRKRWRDRLRGRARHEPQRVRRRDIHILGLSAGRGVACGRRWTCLAERAGSSPSSRRLAAATRLRQRPISRPRPQAPRAPSMSEDAFGCGWATSSTALVADRHAGAAEPGRTR